jgi:diguanylate cyclase
MDRMAPGGTDALTGSYDWRLVALSIVIAGVAAYVALTLGERVAHRGGRERLWLVGGAVAMGGGIWSMHFTAMLAFHLPLPVRIGYDIPIVAVSLLAAVLASGIALFVVSRAKMGLRAWCTGGVLMGSGIAAMHYIGMAAMQMPASIRWDGRVVALSVAIAVLVSLVALRLVFMLRGSGVQGNRRRRALAAVVMGFAVAGMHYTGMAAASFVPAAGRFDADDVMASTLRGGPIFVVTFLILAFVLAMAGLDRRLSAKENALAKSERYFRMVIANAPVILIALDADGTVRVAEGRDLASLGHTADTMIGKSFFKLYDDETALVAQARRALAGETYTSYGTVHGVVIETRWTPLRAPAGEVSGAVAVATDITERRRAEVALKHQALYDALTDLPNRMYLNDRLKEALHANGAAAKPFGLALIDLDRFKEVNDTLGHHVGDVLLKKVADRIARALRETDVAARLGGDEFAVMLPFATESEAIEAVRRLLTVLSRPYVVDGRTLEITGSVGLAFYPEHGTDPAILLRHADVAMYIAKRDHRGYAVYDAAQDRHSAMRLTLEAEMRKGIAHGHFELHYQPQVEVATGRIAQVEALLRWPHPTLGLLPPDQFIPIAEESGMIVPLTQWVLEEAMRQMQTWDEAGMPLGVAVNMSVRSLQDPMLPETISARLKRYATDPNRLTLEVTESVIMTQREQTQEVLARLSALGVGLSIDDFGTGYSSLGYLQQLPVTELKIDKSFVVNMNGTPSKDAEIVRLICNLGHQLGLRVVAEGVETAETWDALVELGCDVIQGYYVARAMPAGELEQWLRVASWHAAEAGEPAVIRSA